MKAAAASFNYGNLIDGLISAIKVMSAGVSPAVASAELASTASAIRGRVCARGGATAGVEARRLQRSAPHATAFEHHSPAPAALPVRERSAARPSSLISHDGYSPMTTVCATSLDRRSHTRGMASKYFAVNGATSAC